ncbi:hypothetical protein PIB30_056001 [Stylosanthes scabra]|uniref:Uncharacterized protein n=1 Tax=Stylosanthes scabra TaxID=79078 RepID=A0ABU6ZHX3_9FABA|nr:hypothetical protein [Stylosanthes scabra]
MAQREDFFADVHPRYHEWNFNVYVIRMWEGDRLHAVLPRPLLTRWGRVLSEFKMFNMRRFIVVDSVLKSRTTETNLVLTFSNRTVVTPVANPSFPLEALRLRAISDILTAERINEAETFDVVALVVGKGDPREMQSKTGKDLKRLLIVVEDLE